MMKKLASGICAKCGKEVSFLEIDGWTNDLTLNNYNFFKRPTINVCPNCGYINDDLTIDNPFFENFKLNLDKNNTLIPQLLQNIKLDRAYLIHLLDNKKRIRVLANIFENCKMLLNNFLADNYTKKDDNTNSVIKEYSLNIKNVCLELEELLKDIPFSNSFYDVLKVEIYSALNELEKAKNIYSKLQNVSPDLDDEIDDFIKIGGLV